LATVKKGEKMTKTVTNNFTNAEHLWFWFVSSRRLQTGFGRRGKAESDRPCELVDIEAMISRLYMSGLLTITHLEILKKYGEKRLVPNGHTEHHVLAMWDQAISVIASECKRRGWIE
jgi:hypothetical protein